jgi:Asp-tRNA(Asn)/Glu-tRNA(Gln) amidotransferase A subunit family amidase
MTEPWQLSAVEALRSFRDKTLSPVELMASTIARAGSVERTVHAFAETRFDDAMDRARRAEEKYARGARVRPLEGLPVALKEETALEGWGNTLGSLAFREQVATRTAPVAERVVRSGAIVHATTTTPEFSCIGATHSRLWGVTRNPWQPSLGVGGSSGGAAASLAAGTTSLASGSDIGGSIRIPAASCGVVGFKPPHGRVPVDAPYNLDRYCHDGPLARTVGDAAVFQNVLAGPHPADVTTLRPRVTVPSVPGGIEGWRIGVSVDLGAYEVHPEVETATRAVADALREAGAVVEALPLPWTIADIARTARAHFGAIFGAEIASVVAEHRELMNDYTLAWAEEAAASAAEPTGFLRGLELEAAMYEPLGRIFRSHRALVCPTMAVPGLPAGDPWLGRTEPVDGGPLDRQYEAFMTVPFNVLSACPVLAVPSGFASNGAPIGVQIVARTYDDAAAFRVGAAIERHRPWPSTAGEVPPPPRDD